MTNNVVDFETAFEQVKKEVAKLLTKGPSLISGYTSYLTEATGKMMRAKAVLACAMDENEMVPRDAIIFAAAVETLHLATLVHDDIMDDADTRRGQITLQKKSGKRNAVICGDYLLASAIREIASVDDTDKYKDFDFSKYVEAIALGELRQNINNRNFRLGTFRYLSIIDGKTAALFEASFHAGAMAGNATEKEIKLYRRLGRYTGIAFQLTDDCIDYEVSEDTALKPVQSDFENGVVTLPLIHTFEEDASLAEKAEKGLISKEEILKEVSKHGGVEYTHKTAERYYKKGVEAINALQLSGKKREILEGLITKAYVGLEK
ncbi:heptaprenyl diphosphate synthase [Pseudobutyrivibrio sp. C4]|uniref:polyprenyl synthetase family protein n=1 Tax=Pseudobutyrivibrio sp. C4 TaxID=1520803 RepID=UPI0008B78E74|nr:polyprenyl synthetase family protein [Pseudobutyrivibrio sp. C4]SET03950.1 heptaprenyl diphosphate synthase [Pseudobutyrivibrio sp. C4]